MKVIPIKTRLMQPGDAVEHVLVESIPSLEERSVLIIASKAFSFAERRFVEISTGNGEQKHDIVKQEAEYYLDPSTSKYHVMFTMKRNLLSVNAGVDESNSAGKFTLLPKDPQLSVNRVWKFARKHYNVKKLGVIMIDSSSLPHHWGVIGRALAHCGFEALKSYVGTKDLYGYEMKMEQLNVAQCLASTGVLEMGEGSEQTPLAIATNITNITFQNRTPSKPELAYLTIPIEDDVYAPFIQGVKWKRGGGGANS